MSIAPFDMILFLSFANNSISQLCQCYCNSFACLDALRHGFVTTILSNNLYVLVVLRIFSCLKACLVNVGG